MSDLEVDSTAMLKNIAYPPCWNWPGSYRLAGKILLPSTPHNHELVARTRLLQVELPQSSKNSHFQSEVKCEAIGMKMIFNYDANKTHFHYKGFALSFVLKVRFFWTRKWPNPVRSNLRADEIKLWLTNQSLVIVCTQASTLLPRRRSMRVGKWGCRLARFTGIKTEFSRIKQDFICRPYSIAKLRCRLFWISIYTQEIIVFPHCPCLNFRSPIAIFIIRYQMRVMKELFMRVIWSCDV